MLKLTGMADSILTRSGNMEVGFFVSFSTIGFAQRLGPKMEGGGDGFVSLSLTMNKAISAFNIKYPNISSFIWNEGCFSSIFQE